MVKSTNSHQLQAPRAKNKETERQACGSYEIDKKLPRWGLCRESKWGSRSQKGPWRRGSSRRVHIRAWSGELEDPGTPGKSGHEKQKDQVRNNTWLFRG